MQAKTYSEKLAKFIHELDFNQIERRVIEQSKKCLLDYIGVSLLGSDTDLASIIISTMKNMGGAKESTIIGDGAKLPCTNAAFVNGTTAHILELDDGHRFAMGHPGVPVISAALSTAEKSDSTGKELIAAIIAGYEVFARIGYSINPSHFQRGFHTTGTCGTFGAAAAAGKILKLNAEELTNALGMAGIQASGLLEVTRGDSVIKPLQPGRAAQSGVLAALLAQKGISAPATILEGGSGFCQATSDNYDLQLLTKELGNNYEIMRGYFKFHASCRHTHSTIDATLKLVNKYTISPEDISEVIIRTYSIALDLCGKEYEPKTVSTAKFSIPYCVSVAIIEGNVDPDVFTIDKIKDQNILGLARKVRIEVDPKIEESVPQQRGSSVEIVKTNGEKYQCFVMNAYGEPEVPATFEALRNKFISLSTKVIPIEKAEKIIDLIGRLETLDNIKEITGELAI